MAPSSLLSSSSSLLSSPLPKVAVHPLDPVEVALGISCYRSSHVAGFSAVSKARFSDFVVHESQFYEEVYDFPMLVGFVVGVLLIE